MSVSTPVSASSLTFVRRGGAKAKSAFRVSCEKLSCGKAIPVPKSTSTGVARVWAHRFTNPNGRLGVRTAVDGKVYVVCFPRAKGVKS